MLAFNVDAQWNVKQLFRERRWPSEEYLWIGMNPFCSPPPLPCLEEFHVLMYAGKKDRQANYAVQDHSLRKFPVWWSWWKWQTSKSLFFPGPFLTSLPVLPLFVQPMQDMKTEQPVSPPQQSWGFFCHFWSSCSPVLTVFWILQRDLHKM